jgi:hypothetical protein
VQEPPESKAAGLFASTIREAMAGEAPDAASRRQSHGE